MRRSTRRFTIGCVIQNVAIALSILGSMALGTDRVVKKLYVDNLAQNIEQIARSLKAIQGTVADRESRFTRIETKLEHIEKMVERDVGR